MTQKVLQIGSSAGITLSKDTLALLGLKIGDEVSVFVNKDGLHIPPASVVDSELVNWTKGFIEQYRPALEALKDK